MRVSEAKDFLVQQIVDQATLENLSLSDLERRMLYFTESDDVSEDPAALNDEFVAQYSTAKYEKKVSHLMAHAYRRIKRESPEKLRLWNDSIRVLRKGDHYILVLWKQPEPGKSWRAFPPHLVGVFAAIGLYSLLLFFFGSRGHLRRGEPAPIDRYIPMLSPPAQHILQFLFLLIIVLTFLPKLTSKFSSLLWSSKGWKFPRKRSK